MQKKLISLSICALILVSASTLFAADVSTSTGSSLCKETDASASSLCEKTDAPAYEKPLKNLTLSANYYLWSDYIFRGVNMTEYLGEGREKPAHQMDVTAEYKFNDIFGVGGKFFASWAAADAELFNGSERNIQELRYTPYLFMDIKEIASRVMLGMNFFDYPNAPKGRGDDSEWFLQICHNDAWMWKAIWPDNEKGVLNPFLFFANNLDEASHGTALLVGINHPFEIPCVDYLTITPQFSIAMDNRLVCKLVGAEPTTTVLFLNYGLTVSYDLSKALKLSPAAGNITLSGNLFYSQAEADYIHDELYGGMQVGWAW